MAREIAKQVKVKGPKGQKGVAILYADGTIFVEWVRFSYPHLDRPWKKDGDQGKPKYSVTAMLPKDTHEAAYDLIQERIEQLLKENKVKKLKSDKIFLRDGDDGDLEEYEGHWTVSAREERRPPLRDRRNEPVDPEDAAEVFRPGYWGAVLIRPWFQNNDWGKRANAGLSSVQFLMKDEEFGGEGRLKEEDIDDTFRKYDDDDDDDDDDRPSRGKKRRNRDDDDDDEDERPSRNKKRRNRDDDDDDDDRPARRKKRRSRDDDDDDDDI